MKAAPFQYHRPESLPAAIGLLADLDNARPIAGGQSLMAMMNLRYVQVDHLVDLNRIGELTGIRIDQGVLEIGAMVRQHMLLESQTVRAHSPLLEAALANVGHMQTRARGTIGGSLCHLDPAAEMPASLLALDAELVLTGPDGERRVGIDDWFLGYMTPNQEPGEILTRIRIPRVTAAAGHAFLEVAQRKGDFAMAAAGCMLDLEEDTVSEVSIVVAGLDTRPVRLRDAEALLLGRRPHADLLAEAARMVGTLDILAGSSSDLSYKKTLAQTLVRRALSEALGQANGSRS